MKTLKIEDTILQKISEETELKDAKPAFDYEFKRKMHKPDSFKFMLDNMNRMNKNGYPSFIVNSTLSRIMNDHKLRNIIGRPMKTKAFSFKKEYLRNSLGILRSDLN